MKNGYTRRADYDLPLPNKLGLLQHELAIAETDEEKANARAAVLHMQQTIERLTPKPSTGDYRNPWVQR